MPGNHCHYCKAEIPDDALKCRHCREWVPGKKPADEPKVKDWWDKAASLSWVGTVGAALLVSVSASVSTGLYQFKQLGLQKERDAAVKVFQSGQLVLQEDKNAAEFALGRGRLDHERVCRENEMLLGGMRAISSATRASSSEELKKLEGKMLGLVWNQMLKSSLEMDPEAARFLGSLAESGRSIFFEEKAAETIPSDPGDPAKIPKASKVEVVDFKVIAPEETWRNSTPADRAEWTREELYAWMKAAYVKGDYETALKRAKEMIEHKPDFPKAHYAVGTLHYALSDWKQAEQAYIKAIERNNKLEPRSPFPEPHNNLAFVYLHYAKKEQDIQKRSNWCTKALASAEKALTEEKTLAKSEGRDVQCGFYDTLGVVHETKANTEEGNARRNGLKTALEWFRKALETAPDKKTEQSFQRIVDNIEQKIEKPGDAQPALPSDPK